MGRRKKLGPLAAAQLAASAGTRPPNLEKRVQELIDQDERERAKGAQTLLKNCASCAAPLPRLAKQCSRCKTRYCSAACQKKHWEEGGHDALCKKIKKGGGAEQYHADKKYKEAVAAAVEACARAPREARGDPRRARAGLGRGCADHGRQAVARPIVPRGEGGAAPLCVKNIFFD